MTADDRSLFSINTRSVFLLISLFVHDCMKAVALNYTKDEVKPQESLPVQAVTTESPTTPAPHRHQDLKRPSEASRAAAYQDPDVGDIFSDVKVKKGAKL